MQMEKILERCNAAIDNDSRKIPGFMWKRCKGVAIITVSEVGFVFSKSEGDGVVMKHNGDGTWGPPSAIKFTGASAGAVFGKSNKQIFLFPMTERGMRILSGQTMFQMGLQMGVAAGPYGAEAEAGIDFGESGAVNVSYAYTFSQGAMLNIGYNNYVIDAANEVNQSFYEADVKAIDIIMTPGAVTAPTGSKGVEDLHAKLAKLSKEAGEAGDDKRLD